MLQIKTLRHLGDVSVAYSAPKRKPQLLQETGSYGIARGLPSTDARSPVLGRPAGQGNRDSQEMRLRVSDSIAPPDSLFDTATEQSPTQGIQTSPEIHMPGSVLQHTVNARSHSSTQTTIEIEGQTREYGGEKFGMEDTRVALHNASWHQETMGTYIGGAVP